MKAFHYRMLRVNTRVILTLEPIMRVITEADERNKGGSEGRKRGFNV